MTLFEKNLDMDMGGVQTSLFDRPTRQYRDMTPADSDIPDPVDLLHIRREDTMPMSFHTSINWCLSPGKWITKTIRVEMIDIYPDGRILLHCRMTGMAKVIYVYDDINTVRSLMDDYPDYTYLQRSIQVPRWMFGETKRILAGEQT